MPASDAPRKRYFSDAQRAVDPLLCEEDTNSVFREITSREPPLWRKVLGWVGHFLFLAGTIGLAVKARLLIRWLGVELTLLLGFAWAAIPAVYESRKKILKLIRGGSIPNVGPSSRERKGKLDTNPPFAACGAPNRELEVSDYLLHCRREVMMPPALSATPVLALLAIIPFGIAGERGLQIAVISCSLFAVVSHHVAGRARAYTSRVHTFIRDPAVMIGKAVGLERLRPERVGRLVAYAPLNQLAKAALFAAPASCIQVSGLLHILVGTGASQVVATAPHLATAWCLYLLFWCGYLLYARMKLEQTRSLQVAWLDHLTAVSMTSRAMDDDQTKDTIRWAHWLHSTHRDPAAPAPELDAKWMASHARE